MGRRPLLAMALGWVLVVVAVATVTFVVVDRAGRGVGQASAAGTVAPLPSDAASATSSSRPTSSATAASSTPVTSGPGATSPKPVARTASFTTDGGTVVATCTEVVLTLGSITVHDGWRFDKESEHGGLGVKFSRGDDDDGDDGDEVEITLGCVDGIPTRLEG